MSVTNRYEDTYRKRKERKREDICPLKKNWQKASWSSYIQQTVQFQMGAYLSNFTRSCVLWIQVKILSLHFRLWPSRAAGGTTLLRRANSQEETKMSRKYQYFMISFDLKKLTILFENRLDNFIDSLITTFYCFYQQ